MKKIRIVLHEVEDGQDLVAAIPFTRRNREQVLEILDHCETVELFGQFAKTGCGRAQAANSTIRAPRKSPKASGFSSGERRFLVRGALRRLVALEDDGFIAVAVMIPALERPNIACATGCQSPRHLGETRRRAAAARTGPVPKHSGDKLAENAKLVHQLLKSVLLNNYLSCSARSATMAMHPDICRAF